MSDQTLLRNIANEVLSTIEFEEEKLLNWGFTRGVIDEDDLVDLLEADARLQDLPLWQDAIDGGYTLDNILENLLTRCLIFRTNRGYFSRFAETVRLMRLLRQRWSYRDWNMAKRLVSDYRINLQRRRYPKRDVAYDELVEHLRNAGINEAKLRAVTALLQRENGQYFKLARFQFDAIKQLFQDTRSRTDRGLVIGAGTGAGKTKAFYIPALATIAEGLSAHPHVQLIAIYPRVELLKDQLKEAYVESRKLDGMVQRPIRIGAYYGQTPTSSHALDENPNERRKWEAKQGGFVCPYLECPTCEAEAENDPESGLRQFPLIWLADDIHANVRRLFCPNCSSHTVDDSTLLLTRQEMRDTLPDILFTTTEMLNRKLGNNDEHELFGVGSDTPPTFLLLDEVHTYHGINGAQIAYLLRRWRFARARKNTRNPLCVVGLSATLLDAEEFFAKLTGLSTIRQEVAYVEPSVKDLIDEGIEYNVVLKGDAGSGAQFLSTTVQTIMLLARMLDQEESLKSQGAWGVKTFGFTDSLDVINRLRFILEDAERQKRLARFRKFDSEEQHDIRAVYEAGQLWNAAEEIGHDLGNSLNIGRTTSQDVGYDADAEVVIATATLEVGFNDPNVGAIVQHKAPHNMASFLQRKGRAGRRRGMRPWMVVVTSDFGRDRWAFHNANDLFDPTLKPSRLPLANDYVRKIQATYALIDWIALKLAPRNGYINVWKELANSGKQGQSKFHEERIKQLLIDVVTGQYRDELTNYLCDALELEHHEIEFLLWREPRSLLFQVIPSVLRQLDSRWAIACDDGSLDLWADSIVPNGFYPLPEFLPSSLFSDLNLPEIAIEYPTYTDRNSGETYTEANMMTLQQGMREYAPGRANKRYSLTYGRDTAHWLAVPETDPQNGHALSVHDLAVQFDTYMNVVAGNIEYRVYRPLHYQLTEPPSEVRNSSYGELIWQSLFKPDGFSMAEVERSQDEQDIVKLHTYPQWGRLLMQATIFTQSAGTWITVTRFADRARLETRFDGNRDDERRTIRFVDEDGNLEAVGYQIGVDGIAFYYRPLDIAKAKSLKQWKDISRPLKSRFFQEKLHGDQRLADLSLFAIDWLAQLHITAITAIAVADQCTLTKAEEKAQSSYINRVREMMLFIFQSQSDEDDVTGVVPLSLLEYLKDPDVKQALFDWFKIFSDDLANEFEQWMINCYASSLATTLYTVILRMLPNIAPADLVVDIDSRADVIWLTETSIGGAGIIESIAEQIVTQPRQFEMHLLNTVDNCEREDLANQFTILASFLEDDSSTISQAFKETREMNSLRELSRIQNELSDLFIENDIFPTRKLFVEMNGKMLRPNSSTHTDHLLSALAAAWDREESRLNINLDLDIFSVVAYQILDIKSEVDELIERIGWEDQTSHLIFTTIQSMLWLTCRDSCNDCIATYNPFHTFTHPSRPLIAVMLKPEGTTVGFGEEDWHIKARNILETAYEVEITCSLGQIAECKQAILGLLLSPIDTDYQLFYPSIDRVSQSRDRWTMHIAIDELLGG